MISVLLYTLGVVFFVLAILISVALHELGHMIPAKKFGCKVSQYFVGFGPTVWSFHRGETEYGIKAFPLGGYVKIVGMLPPSKDEVIGEDGMRIRKSNTGLFTQVISDAKAAEYETIKPEDYDRLFYKISPWKKVIVMSGGPLVNLAIAFFVFLGIFALYGDPKIQSVPDSTKLSAVSSCLVAFDKNARECTADDPQSPASAAGLEAGDTIVSLDGKAVKDWPALVSVLDSTTETTLPLVYERDGVEVETVISPYYLDWPNGEGELTKRAVVGISPEIEMTLVKGGPIYTAKKMASQFVYIAEAIVQLPEKVINVANAIFGIEERDPNGPVSVVGGSRFAGETVADDDPANTWPAKFAFLFSIVAGFNYFLFAFNLLPILPLDGGHVAGAIWEGLKKRIAKLRRRPDPGPVDIAKMLPVAQFFGYALFVLGIVLIIGDLVVPIRLS